MIRIFPLPAAQASPPRQPMAVLRSPTDPELWAAHSVDPFGGVGPRCSPFMSRQDAEAFARAAGELAEPHDEAA